MSVIIVTGECNKSAYSSAPSWVGVVFEIMRAYNSVKQWGEFEAASRRMTLLCCVERASSSERASERIVKVSKRALAIIMYKSIDTHFLASNVTFPIVYHYFVVVDVVVAWGCTAVYYSNGDVKVYLSQMKGDESLQQDENSQEPQTWVFLKCVKTNFWARRELMRVSKATASRPGTKLIRSFVATRRALRFLSWAQDCGLRQWR